MIAFHSCESNKLHNKLQSLYRCCCDCSIFSYKLTVLLLPFFASWYCSGSACLCPVTLYCQPPKFVTYGPKQQIEAMFYWPLITRYIIQGSLGEKWHYHPHSCHSRFCCWLITGVLQIVSTIGLLYIYGRE